MARLARFFVKGQPQHIIQRGNNREVIFADQADYIFYLDVPASAFLDPQITGSPCRDPSGETGTRRVAGCGVNPA